MSTEYNYRHVKTICPECKGDNILVDDYHQETYCTNCGLIIHDNTLYKITQELEKQANKNRWLNQFWKDTNRKIKLKEMRDIWKIK